MHAVRFARLALAAGTAAVLMTGCGAKTLPTSAVNAASAQAEAQATQTLLDGFSLVYAAAFTKLDANNDGIIDEYEAGPFIDLRDVSSADTTKDHKLSKAEFMAYASQDGPFHGWFGFCHQDKEGFLKGQRNQLLKAFDKLDVNHDHLLTRTELGDSAVTARKLTLSIPGLKLNVQLKKFSDVNFKDADKTGDDRLGQAEFEDYALDGFIGLVNPGFDPNPTPPAPQPAPSDAPPAPAPAA